jgi:TPR repeat protein
VAQFLSNAPDTPLKAVPFFQKACEGKDSFACYQLGLAYAQGYLGLNADQDKATELYRQACDQDLGPACFNLAWQFLRGSGAPHDEAKGNLLLEKSCVLGDASGCDELDRRKPDHARFCELWGAEACFNLAASITQERGEVAEVAEAIINAATRACERKHEGACRTLRHLAKDTTRQCLAGSNVRDTCMFSAIVYQRGLLDEVASSANGENEAAASLTKACKAGAEVACVRMKAGIDLCEIVFSE